jgi:hypothetical protein
MQSRAEEGSAQYLFITAFFDTLLLIIIIYVLHCPSSPVIQQYY